MTYVLTDKAREILVAYAVERKMPKKTVNAYLNGTNDDDPLPQLIAKTFGVARDDLESSLDRAKKDLLKVKEDYVALREHADKTHGALMDANKTITKIRELSAGAWWGNLKKIKALF